MSIKKKLKAMTDSDKTLEEKLYIVLTETNKRAYEIMDENIYFVQFTEEDIDWKSLKKLPEKALDRAHALSAQFPSFIRGFQNGVAEVSWQLNPDGRYYMDEDGFGITSDNEIEIYGFIDREMNVLVKFQYIGEDWELLRALRKQAEAIYNEKSSISNERE